MTLWLLDTNIVSQLVKDPFGKVAQRVEVAGGDEICTSIVVACELRYGAEKRGSSKLAERIENTLLDLEVLPLDEGADLHYATLRTDLERKGTPIGPNDMLIAAHALALDCILVTDNTGEFSRIEGLRLENWLR